MSQFFSIHPESPQLRLIRRAVEIVRQGGLIAYPTDSCYALGCQLGNKGAVERIRRIRKTGKHHIFTLVCGDLSEISTYAKVDNSQYRFVRKLTPGPYTFVLHATNEVPRRLSTPGRRTIGIRVPDSPIVRDLVGELGEPIMSTTLTLPEEIMPMTEAEDIRECLEHSVDLVIDGGHCGHQPTTVIDLLDDVPRVTRSGRGPTNF